MKKSKSLSTKVICLVVVLMLACMACMCNVMHVNAAAQVKGGEYNNPVALKVNKQYKVTGLTDDTKYGKFTLTKTTKISFQITGVKSGMTHIQVYNTDRDGYTNDLLHDMQISASSEYDSDPTINTASTWDYTNGTSVALKLKKGTYMISFSTDDDVYSNSDASSYCNFRMETVK